MKEKIVSDITLEEIQQRIKSELVRKRQAHGVLCNNNIKFTQEVHEEETKFYSIAKRLKQIMERSKYYRYIRPLIQPFKIIFTDRMKYRQISIADQLLQYDGIEFIKKSYQSILLRDPEPEGLQYYANLIIEGTPKEVILFYIIASPEAKEKKFKTNKMKQLELKNKVYRLKQRLKKIPVISPLFLYFYGLLKLPFRIGEISKIVRKMQMDISIISSNNNEEMRLLKIDNERFRNEQNYMKNVSADIHNQLNNINDANVYIQNELNCIKGILEKNELNILKKIGYLQKDNEIISNEMMSLNKTSKLVINAGNNLVVTKYDEFVVGLPAEDWKLVSYIAYWGHLELGLGKLFRKCVKSGMIIVDVGANIGIYTLIAASMVGSSGKVYSFEPTPRTFDILKGNVQVNGLLETNRVVFKQMAVSDKRGIAKLAVYKDNLGHNTLYPNEGDKNLIEVETISMDEVLGDEQRVDIVKIDAEGSEPFILRGMKRIIEKNPDITIFMEFAPCHLIRADINVEEFIKEIYNYGFTISKVDDMTGELVAITEHELIDVFSVNIMLRRNI